MGECFVAGARAAYGNGLALQFFEIIDVGRNELLIDRGIQRSDRSEVVAGANRFERVAAVLDSTKVERETIPKSASPFIMKMQF